MIAFTAKTGSGGVMNSAERERQHQEDHFFCTDPDDMHYPELANKVRYFKEDKKGVQSMCKMMEEMRNAVRIENARKMLADGLSIEKVAQYSGLPLKTVRELSNEKSA